jgi:FkbM family methyltransferase
MFGHQRANVFFVALLCALFLLGLYHSDKIFVPRSSQQVATTASQVVKKIPGCQAHLEPVKVLPFKKEELIFASTDPKVAMLPTGQLEYQKNSLVEQATVALMRLFFSRGCGKDSLMLDMGANDGFYALLGSAYGCAVKTVEPQRACVDRLNFARIQNNFTRMHIFNNVVASHPVEVDVPVTTCSGEAHYDTSGKGQGFMESFANAGKFEAKQTTKICSISVDEDLVEKGGKVFLWHIDVEGAEVDVIRSGRRLLEEKRVQHLIIENNPGRWPIFGVSAREGVELIASLMQKSDFVCFDLSSFNPLESALVNLKKMKSYEGSALVNAFTMASDFYCGKRIDATLRTPPEVRSTFATWHSSVSNGSLRVSAPLVFGAATSDCFESHNRFPAECALHQVAPLERMQSLLSLLEGASGGANLQSALEKYESKCNQMVFGEGVKRKFVVYRPFRGGLGNRFQEFASAATLALLTGRHIAVHWTRPTHFSHLFNSRASGFELDFNQIESIAFPSPSNGHITFSTLWMGNLKECDPYPNEVGRDNSFREKLLRSLDDALDQDVDVIVIEGWDYHGLLNDIMDVHARFKGSALRSRLNVSSCVSIGWKALGRWIRPSSWVAQVMNGLISRPTNKTQFGFRVSDPSWSDQLQASKIPFLCLQIRTGSAHTSGGLYSAQRGDVLKQFAKCAHFVGNKTQSPLRILVVSDSTDARKAVLSMLQSLDVVFIDYPAIHSGWEHGCRDGAGNPPSIAAHVHTVAEFLMLSQCDGLLTTFHSSFGESAFNLNLKNRKHTWRVGHGTEKEPSKACPGWDLSL